jgi:poly(A) polymerase
VQLSPIVDHNYNLKIWDPKVYPADKYHKMPVITPVYPSMCATHNVTQSTFNVICAEFHRGHDMMRSGGPLAKLFEHSDYFRRYKIFVEVNIRCEDPGMFKMWEGYTESKIRILSTKLENLENIVAAIPFPKAFRMSNLGGEPGSADNAGSSCTKDENVISLEKNESSCWFFIAIDVALSKNMPKKVYVDAPIKDFLDFVNSWDQKTQEMKIEIKPKKKRDVQGFIRAFYKEK